VSAEPSLEREPHAGAALEQEALAAIGEPVTDPRTGTPPPSRSAVWKLLGAPTDQVGSVNDPRTHEEFGVTWNEKWIYRDGQEIVRVVLWNRYDFLGVFRVAPDGSGEREPLESFHAGG